MLLAGLLRIFATSRTPPGFQCMITLIVYAALVIGAHVWIAVLDTERA
jgi:hypothetical protein